MSEKNKIVFLESGINIICYALILVMMSELFQKTIQIDNSYFGIWGLLISLVIFIMNKTVKPIIFSLTLPITALTLGIFYPFINLFILKIVDLLFFNHFNIHGFFMSLLVAILISFTNMILAKGIIKPMIRRNKNESHSTKIRTN